MKSDYIVKSKLSKKTLTVCGDSWFSTDERYPNQSFGEILADRHNLELINLARSGCSNFAIALQVDTAINMRPDFIIVGCTSHDRIEIPIIKKLSVVKKILKWIPWSGVGLTNAAYEKKHGLLNVQYSHNIPDLSRQYSNPEFESIISDTIGSLLFNKDCQISTGRTDALKKYLVFLYDSGIKQQIDCWVMSDVARRLIESKIPFLFYVEPLFNHDFIADIDWLDSRYKIMYTDFSYYQYQQGPATFHLKLTESESFANHWEQRLIIEGIL